VRQGDESAFGVIVTQYAPGLLGFVRANLHSREAAEDLVQELFLSIWARRDTWHVGQSLKTYLYQAARKRVLNYWRDRQVEQRYLDSVETNVDINAAVHVRMQSDTELEEEELLRAVTRAIARMPNRVKQVFLLHRTRELSYVEIGDVLGISRKTVEIHMGRALALLRESLKDWR
jgi:RNA polymerase sigma-70 factor (ECF subfamily)